jgi:hypothetical protein
MLVEAFKHYSKYASQALKVAMPKGGMRGDINPRHMQQVRAAGRQAAACVLDADEYTYGFLLLCVLGVGMLCRKCGGLK